MVERCGTVWTSPNTGHEYLLVGDQMLWFRSQMDHSLINPNQIHEYGIPVYDNTFSQSQIGIDCNDDFIPFNTTGTIVYFETHVPTDWETCNLPIIMLTGEDWDPVKILDLVMDKAGNKRKCEQFGLWKLECQNER
jgi:hypothetical protein